MVLGTPKNQCCWAGDDARGNFLKNLEIVTSEIIESKWSGGKQISFFVIYWEWAFTEMPGAMLMPLYTSLQSPLLQAAPTNK